MKEASDSLDAMEEMPQGQKQMMLGMIKMVKGIANSLEKTKNKEEFMQTLMTEAGPLKDMFGGMLKP